MPTKEQIRLFLEEHAPGKPEIRDLCNSFWVEWDNDVSMSLRDDGWIKVRNSIGGRNFDEALEFSTLYLNVLVFARKAQKFLTTP